MSPGNRTPGRANKESFTDRLFRRSVGWRAPRSGGYVPTGTFPTDSRPPAQRRNGETDDDDTTAPPAADEQTTPTPPPPGTTGAVPTSRPARTTASATVPESRVLEMPLLIGTVPLPLQQLAEATAMVAIGELVTQMTIHEDRHTFGYDLPVAILAMLAQSQLESRPEPLPVNRMILVRDRIGQARTIHLRFTSSLLPDLVHSLWQVGTGPEHYGSSPPRLPRQVLMLHHVLVRSGVPALMSTTDWSDPEREALMRGIVQRLRHLTATEETEAPGSWTTPESFWSNTELAHTWPGGLVHSKFEHGHSGPIILPAAYEAARQSDRP